MSCLLNNNQVNFFQESTQFKHCGETRIPVASVTADGKTYTTPEYRVSVHPAEVDMSKLECHLKVEQLKSDKIKYRAILTCNVRPDQNPPMPACELAEWVAHCLANDNLTADEAFHELQDLAEG